MRENTDQNNFEYGDFSRSVYITLVNDFDKTFVLAFHNSFLKIEFNFDRENMAILNTCSFQKMLSNLTCALIYSF